MKPVIGLTSHNGATERGIFNMVKYTYIDAIAQSGGIPITIPKLESLEDIPKYLEIIDGIIFTGGEDISPLLYGEEPIKEVRDISIKRDRMELELFRQAYEKGIPILGICRGHQLINVALGGSLYQDIHAQLPETMGHLSTYRLEEPYHSIKITRDSILHKIFGRDKIGVNSQHHQSIKSLGKNLRISGKALDGIIEAVESTRENFVLGVQFHPEVMINENKEYLKIFEYFIWECNKNKIQMV